MTRKVALALYVIDDLTNDPIPRGRIQASIAGMAPPIYKEDGWLCFMDLPEGSYTVFLEGAVYQKNELEIYIGGDGPTDAGISKNSGAGCPVITVRMMPGPSYRMPDNAVCIFGQAAPGSEVRAVFKPAGTPLKLLYDYKEGLLIRIFSSEMKSLDGRSFSMDEKEIFSVRQTIDEDERIYLMDRELKGSYKKGKARIYLAGKTRADEKGNFYLVSRCFGRGLTRCVIEVPEAELGPMEIEALPGEKICVANRLMEPLKEEK